VVTRLDAAAGIDETELLRLAAIAEFHSEHPLARAVIREAEARGIAAPEPADFRYTVARGINATHAGRMILVGNRKLLAEAGVAVPADGGSQEGSEILVAADGRYMGAVTVADPLRPEAVHAVARLNDLGLRTVLLTGDVARVGQKVGARLGIAEVKSDLMPEDKHRLVRAMTARKRIVAMIGDGVNDAPALTAASVGVAMGSGTDIAQESADIVLIGNDLNKLVETVLIARQTRRIIWQNFTGTLVIDAVGIGLAAFGLLNPLVAAAIHVGSELAFILNSARLLALKAQPSAKKPEEKQDLEPASS
jgi:P-type E1-E2 ATPase